MTLRTGMTNLVAQLRAMTDADAAEFAIGSETYWSNDHLQDELDRNRYDVYRESLRKEATMSGGTATYFDYYWEYGDVEEAASGDTIWRVENSLGSAIGTANYSVNYQAKHIRFAANTGGTAYYLTYRYYDMNRSAAAVWMKKAANVANRFDVKTDNHDLKRSQMRQAYIQMAQSFKTQRGGRTSHLIRDDVNG